MDIFNNFSDLFFSVWSKGIHGIDIFQILIGIGIFFIFLISEIEMFLVFDIARTSSLAVFDTSRGKPNKVNVQ